MAAVVERPRIVRDTTNMERAAEAAAVRNLRASLPAGQVDPDLIDNSMGDLQVARTFIEAADNFIDEIRRWVGKNGCMPSEPLAIEADNAQIMLFQTIDKITAAEDKLRVAGKHALQIWCATADSAPDPQHPPRFDLMMHRYRMAYLTGQGFYLLNYPGDDAGDYATHEAFQASWDELVDKTRDAALAALLTPATSAADMADKQVVIDQQEAVFWNSDEVAAFTRQLVADAIAFAGGAA